MSRNYIGLKFTPDRKEPLGIYYFRDAWIGVYYFHGINVNNGRQYMFAITMDDFHEIGGNKDKIHGLAYLRIRYPRYKNPVHLWGGNFKIIEPEWGKEPDNYDLDKVVIRHK
jgi:hypothetical protein